MRKTPFIPSSKTPTVHRKAKQNPTLDDEDSQATEDENWVEDLREYLKAHLQCYLETAGMD